ncbi:MAG: DUF58 domain-containing protein [Nitrospirae bacterium CG18_big_fil_WC_8_21_14_2_50_70_55]|nr:DUF58 domain-containing protein [Deltaproteobacteria bacterium]OIP61897.1 MAG: hypothetical protein AUK30_11200 [Nitrospirae bacterium CG2_30_70_394]PIQ04152.1 MAG: DUF58 domain-containing protein [Nitrospirae bacterium CG18_big_fil_WC_8_21_14_2_50_70_55]PIU79758.1 MAG: DUF58 domain-containing protein [Nitrospirae bacterium CG06_land_8_20_14_3_00_70_43]PIW82400.1 MAG: DUF58 domain-containing protein [Nitrospirae bacterium CG_4_8_14_3_um_filter_70_85]PIX82130.1 MAG: DUF58 domain-containing p
MNAGTTTTAQTPQEVLRRVRRIEIRARRLVDQVVAGEYHSTFRGQGLEFDQVREYCPGDDVRAIDWNVTARTGHPFIKTFAETRELTVILAVDGSASTRVGPAAVTVAERLAEVGALLAFSAIRNNDKAGLLLFTDRIESFVPPRKGSHHCLRLIRDLLYPAVTGVRTDLGGALAYLSRVVRRRAVVFLLSDFFATGFGPDLRVAARRHEVVPVRLTDPLGEELPAAGLTCLTDPEGGAPVWVDTASAAVRAAYRSARGRHRAEVDRLFRGARLLPLDLDLTGDCVAPLRSYFHQRGMRR